MLREKKVKRFWKTINFNDFIGFFVCILDKNELIFLNWA